MKNSAHSDGELVVLFKNGQDWAFEVLLTRHKSRVYSTIQLIVKDRDHAEDLFQEVFIKAIDVIRSGRYNEEGKFLPWVLRIAHNLAIDSFRREKRYPTIPIDDNPVLENSLKYSEKSFEILQAQQDTKVLLRYLITTLPETQREVLMMRHFAGLSFQEIADATGVSINTALGRMRYALMNLRKKLEKSNFVYDKDLYPK